MWIVALLLGSVLFLVHAWMVQEQRVLAARHGHIDVAYAVLALHAICMVATQWGFMCHAGGDPMLNSYWRSHMSCLAAFLAVFIGTSWIRDRPDQRFMAEGHGLSLAAGVDEN